MSYKVFHLFIVLTFVLSLSFAPVSSAVASTAQQAGANLIINGDFEAGNTGFSSGYTVGPIGMFEGVYEMLTDPFAGHPLATSFRDHTSGSGLMMAVNGIASTGIQVWGQSVPVTAGTDYEFSVWVASWYPVSPAELQFLINGSPVGTFTASTITGIWQKFAATWNSGTSTSAMLEITNLNALAGGNDFALDDLSFESVPCAPNLVVNGDFEARNIGFSSGYTFGLIGVFEGVYQMVTNPFPDHPAATSFRDHTSGSGLMMAVNGIESTGIQVWGQSVPVTAGTDYEFSVWVASWYPAAPAELQFLINGSPVGTFTAPSTTGVWQQFTMIGNSGASTSATIEIVNLNTTRHGNDFALDDLSLRVACNTSTGTPTNTPTNTPTSTPTGTPSQACGPTLVINGDFEAGNTGFSSGYTLGPIGMFEGVYEMLTDPFVGHPLATSFRDHTSGSGLMMAVNGIASTGIQVWGQSVPVTAGTDYEFSVWVASWYPVSPAELQFLINGSPVGTFTASPITGIWQKFAATWNSGTSTSAMLEITNLNALAGGNDFALDDIALRGLTCNTPTSTPTGSTTGTPTNTPTNTPTGPVTGTPTNTPTATQTPGSELGQLKLCKVAGTGVALRQLFTFTVGSSTYNVPAGFCILAGQFPVTTRVTINETIPAGYFVSRIEVRPPTRMVSTDRTHGQAVVQIGGGITEVVFTNFANGAPTPTPTPSGLPTPTANTKGRFQICKEASGAGVTGNFTFRYQSRVRTVPVGACSLASWADAGTLTITEDARTGYVVSDIYTIPANRLISKDLSGRKVTVTIVTGTSAAQTIIVFVNRAVTSAAISDVVANTPRIDVRLSENPLDAFMQILRNSVGG